MRKFIGSLKILYYALKYAVSSWILTMKGQKPQYEILMLSHKLEKGMLNTTPKPMWGWDKAHRLNDLIKGNNDSFINITGKSVLSAYLNQKTQSADERERKMVEFYPNELSFDRQMGGGCPKT